MNVFVFGSSLLSSYWNGSATYFRGIYRALNRKGHRITYAEPDILGRSQQRDLEQVPELAEVELYSGRAELDAWIDRAMGHDVVVKHASIGADDAYLERRLVERRDPRTRLVFWDADAPATLSRLQSDAASPLRTVLPGFDVVVACSGGVATVQAYRDLGARHAVATFRALDPQVNHPVAADSLLKADVLFLGNRHADRDAAVERIFFRAAELCPEMRFLLAGAGWGDCQVPTNVRVLGHCPTSVHNVLNASARFVLNLTRDPMREMGHSPTSRLFEAAGAGACLVSDRWAGMDQFFTPDQDLLTVDGGEDLARHLATVDAGAASRIGAAARERVLREHTIERRLEDLTPVLLAPGVQPLRALSA